MKRYVGDDWAETQHDDHLMTAGGERLATRRVPEGLAGIAALHALIAAHAAPRVISSTKRCGSSATASSATCMAACGRAPATARPPRGTTASTTNPSPLDTLRTWGVLWLPVRDLPAPGDDESPFRTLRAA